jgi:type III secretion HrpO family protein
MSPDNVGTLAHDALLLAILMSAPSVAAAAIVGMLFGVLQALTQLQDQATAYAVKLVVVLVLLMVTTPWLSALIKAYGLRVFALLAEV